MDREHQLPPGLSHSLHWQREMRETFCEGIGDAIYDAADNLQFSRHLFALPAGFDRELKGIESELRGLVARLHGIVRAIEQADVARLQSGMEGQASGPSPFRGTWLADGDERQAA